LICQIAIGQVTFIVNQLPENHDYSKSIYISGDFEGWSGGSDQFRLTQNNKQYSITIPNQRETINFKFTLGSWDFVESDPVENSIENRFYTYKKTPDTVAIEIENWTSDTPKIKASTAAENVYVFADNFEIPKLKRTRKISIYLPPDYQNSKKSYPVLYMHDGQNVFDLSTSYAGEWEVDETLNRLSSEIGLNLIVVAIDHGNEKRMSEYTPWGNKKNVMAEGKDYIDFIANTLKPTIDKTFRTKTNAKNTVIMGSSLGGLISHYAGLKYPNVFGKVGVFSPSFWYVSDSFDFTQKHSKLKHLKMYYLVGGKEGEDMVASVDKMVQLMKANGFRERNIYKKIVSKLLLFILQRINDNVVLR
jgi:predicted alpha/beta superfamily hydrolase